MYFLTLTFNFIDKTFKIFAELILKFSPINRKDKKSFSYYQVGLEAQDQGRYDEALNNYLQSIKLEETDRDLGTVLYNIGLIHDNNGNFIDALIYYHRALGFNKENAQIWYNIAVIYHTQAARAEIANNHILYLENLCNDLYNLAAKYWLEALKLAPDTYPEVISWFKSTGRAYLLSYNILDKSKNYNNFN